MDIQLRVLVDVSDRTERLIRDVMTVIKHRHTGKVVSELEDGSKKGAAAPQIDSDGVSVSDKGIATPEKKRVVKSDIEALKEHPGGAELVEKLDLEVMPVSDQELRTAMDECRKRLLGDEPKNNPHYRALTDFIRTMVADTYGAAVLSDIPSDLRPNFVRDMKEIRMDADGKFLLPGKEEAPF